MMIRKPNLENLTKEGIPKDFADVRDYFNKALENGTLPLIPRKTPITNEEILERWIPSLKTNISLVAEKNNKVIGSATVFYDTNSSDPKFSDFRKPGELNSTVDPSENRYIYYLTTKEMIKGIKQELIKMEGIENVYLPGFAHCYVPVENILANKVFEQLGYKGKEEFLERYKTGKISGKVFRYELP